MSIDLKKLRKNAKDAEDRAHKLQGERYDAMQKVRSQYDQKCRDANDAAAAAQKELLDAEVAASLADRPDGETVARGLVEQGALSRDLAEAAGINLD